MKLKLSVILVVGFLANNVLAEKPEWAGQGKPDADQKAVHRAAMEAKQESEAEEPAEKKLKEKKEKSEKLKDASKTKTEKTQRVCS